MKRIVILLSIIFGLPLLFLVLAALLTPSPNDPIAPTAHVQKSLAQPVNQSATMTAARPQLLEPPRPTVDLRGYKGAQWGMDERQVSEAMSAEFTQVSNSIFGNGPNSPAANNWAIRSLFYELWGVPKSKTMLGMPYYHDDFVPSKFSVSKTENGGCAVFFEGKLSAYHFEVRAKNYEQLLKKLSGEYGLPTNRTVTFDHPSANTPQDSEPHENLVHTWELGHTILRLSHDQTRAIGMITTDVHVIYESRDIRARIVNQIQKSAALDKANRKNEDAAAEQDDLKKL